MFTLCVGGNLVSYFVIERVDRRVLYIGGVALCTIMNLLIACVSYGSSQAAAYTTVVFVFLWAFIYEATVGPLTYALITELPQGRMRAKSVAITSNVNSLCSFGLGYLIPYLFNPDEVNMGLGSCTGVVLFVVMLFFLPETRGRTANEIEQLFVNKVGALKFKRAKFDEDDKLIMSSVGKEATLLYATCYATGYSTLRYMLRYRLQATCYSTLQATLHTLRYMRYAASSGEGQRQTGKLKRTSGLGDGRK
ncbi:hypothetical protein FOA43_002642, partial [Brettanomyces nanus]